MGTQGRHAQYRLHCRLAHLPIAILVGMENEQMEVEEAVGNQMATKNEEL